MPKLSGDTYANNIPRHLCQTYLEAPMSNNIWRHLCQTIWRHLCQKYLEARMPKLSGGTYVNIIWRHQCQTNVWRHPSTTPIPNSTWALAPTLRPTQYLLAGRMVLKLSTETASGLSKNGDGGWLDAIYDRSFCKIR